MRYLTLLLVMMLSAASFAQATISGVVRDNERNAVEAALITAFSTSDSTIVGYGLSDDAGRYSVEIAEATDSLILQISGFNIRKEQMRLANASQTVDWICTEESIELKEIQVQAQKLWGSKDTLNYLVSAYTRDHDVTIGDILKQLPGIDIKPDGTISYQGMPISRFYIENMDLLQGRYNIAAKTIKAEDIATVQVLERHEHIKALQDQTPPEAAAINLKLKKDRGGIWSGRIDAKAGYDEKAIWNVNASEMFVGKQSQHMFYYETANDGTDNNAFMTHYGTSGITAETITSVVVPSQSPVGKSIRNNYHEVATNNIRKIDDNTELHYNVSLMRDVRKSSGYNRITYLMPDGASTIMEEDLSAKLTGNKVEMNFDYEKNAEDRFVSNRLFLEGSWNDANGSLKGSESIRQTSSDRTLGARDRLEIVNRTTEGKGYRLISDLSYSSTPQSLRISPSEWEQTATIDALDISNNFNLLSNLRVHKFSLLPTAHLNVRYMGIESELTRYPGIPSAEGRMNYSDIDLGVGLRFNYTRKKLSFTADLPISLLYTNANNRDMDNTSRTKPVPGASYRLNWRVNDKWNISGNGKYGVSQNSWREMYSSYVLSNYRTLTRYEGGIYDTESLSASVRSTYQNIMHEFFAWAEFYVTNSKSDVMYGSSIDDNGYTTMQINKAPHQTNTLLSRLNLRKDFDWKKTNFDVTFSYQRTSSEYLRQSVVTKYNFDGYGIAGKISITPFRRLVIYYNTDWSLNKSKTVEDVSSETIEVWTNKLIAHLTLIKNRLFLSSTGSHQYNSILSGDKHHFFLDANIRIKVRNKSDLHLRATNLLNTKNYYSVENFDMMERYSEYSLLPRAIMLEYQINF